MEFTVRPIGPGTAAEISGLDLAKPPDTGIVESLRATWHAHPVLVLRGQALSEKQQLSFAECFGPLGVRTRRPENRPEGRDADNVMLVTNIRENGVPIGSLPDGEMFFHHDQCYVVDPHIASLLYAIEVPSWGGSTLFADMYRAYETLPPALAEKIAGRRALQVYKYHPTEPVDADDDLDAYDHYWQPTVIVHPATGRKALYVNRLMSARIEGLGRADSDATLAALFDHLERPEHVYAHQWRPGDLLMWDNRCTCHARTDFPDEETRLLRRCTVAGAPMIAA